jgi:hypothetical protein
MVAGAPRGPGTPDLGFWGQKGGIPGPRGVSNPISGTPGARDPKPQFMEWEWASPGAPWGIYPF